MTLPIRLDEPYTMITTAHGPSYAVERALSFEDQPPIYFFLVSIWRVVNKSLTWVRLFSVVFYPFIVISSYYLARYYAPKKTQSYLVQ